MYAVQDLKTALETVTAHGGTAGKAEMQPYGLSAECKDNQGIEFWLWQP
jgi:predicted enzyme related to lactoylglutathione lyase